MIQLIMRCGRGLGMGQDLLIYVDKILQEEQQKINDAQEIIEIMEKAINLME